ncbi:RNA polymerase sigma factor [Pirellulaceae bacterium SH501]
MKNPGETNFEEIVNAQIARVYRIAFRILGSTQDAEDVTQVVFAEAYRSYLKKCVSDWTGYLVRLATHRSIDTYRSRRKLPSCLSNDVPSDRNPPLDNLVAKESVEWLRAEIANLPAQQGAVFTLIYFENMDRSEVADCLSITLQSVSTSLHKAREKLKERYKYCDKEIIDGSRRND